LKKKVLLLDGYNLIYRARHSRMNKGEYSTVFNFFRSLRPLIELFDPDLTYFVLEGRPVKRLSMDSEYKGQRTYHNKDNFNEQRRKIISLLKEYFPFIVARHEDYECDDIINYLANDKHEEDDCVIISSDTDFIQSINDNTKLYSPVRKTFLDKTEYNYVMWKALVGDASDNIEGFKGIGDKSAKKMLANENLLSEFLLKEGHQEKFDKNKFMIAFHSLEEDKETIDFVSLDKTYEWDLLKKEFMDMEFNSIIGKEKTWEKYIKTFSKLERNRHDN